jgi:uncharacterized membrane protein YdjX (TVP38/TMEM64 family)
MSHTSATVTRWVRRVVLFALICAIICAIAWLLLSERGRQIQNDPRAFGREVRLWVEQHPVSAPAMYIGAYVLASVLALPMWWIQIVGGYSFGGPRYGVILAVFYTQIGGTIGATLTSGISHWLMGEWFQKKVESRTEKLRSLDERMGHNGLLVVMLVRLTHIIPYNVANYLFGLTRVSLVDVALGTLLGNIPSAAFYTTLGYHPSLLRHWRFSGTIAAINIILLIPLVLRYSKPQWFRKIGVE